jgi:hypothetical protein
MTSSAVASSIGGTSRPSILAVPADDQESNLLAAPAIDNHHVAQSFSSESGCPMPHKFKVGELVSIRPALNLNVPGGIYEVTKQLPGAGGECEYRIKSVNEPHERVARESELSKA